MTQPHPDVMTSEVPPQHAIVLDSTILTPDTAHALGPSPGASSATASTGAVTPGQRATRSDWQVGNALFDLQMNPFHAPDHGTTVSSSPGPPQEDKVPAASLNPYRDGRIRTAVPSKLKGRTNMKQGNFSVMHMHLQKPQVTERDLAAKRTSERTAAAAKLASAQGYRYPRRPRPPHTAAARTPSQSLSNLPSVIADIYGPVAQPPPLRTVMPYEEQRAETGSAQASTGLEENPLMEAGNVENIETEILAESTKGEVAPGVNHEQQDSPFIDANSTQDVSMNPSNEFVTPADPTQETNREPPAITKLLATTLPPEEVRAEQYRLLELLRKLHPTTVVETLCSALYHFGGATRRLPSPDGGSSESGSKKSSGDLFISWISEIFPPNFAENSTTKRPLKPSTGRPRGRPKGSTKKLVHADLHLKRTAFVPLAMRPDETNGTQPSTLVKCSGAPPDSVANNPGSDMPLPRASNNQSPREARRSTSGPSITPAELTSTSALVVPNSSVTTLKRTKSTGRPRGRPKGSKNKPRLLPAKPASSSFNSSDSHLRESRLQSHEPTTRENTYKSLISTPDSSYVTETASALRNTFSFPVLPDPAEEAASTMQGGATGSPGCTQVNKARTAGGSSVIIQELQGPPNHHQDAVLVSSKKRKNSQQGPCTNTRVIDTPQTSPRTARLATNHPHEKQVKRLCVSQETNPRNLGTSERYSQSADAEAIAFRSGATTRHTSSISGIFASGVQAIGLGDSLSQQVPQSPSHLYQQDQGLKQFDESYQTQADQGVQLQRKHQPRHHSPQDLRSEQSIRPTSLSSPTNTQPHSRDLGAPEDVLREVTVLGLYQRQQRQQRQLSNQLGHSAAGPFSQTARSSPPRRAQRLDSRPLVPQYGQQGLRHSTGTIPLPNMDHSESHHHLEESAPIASMDKTPPKPCKTASAPVADMS
ncbi:hypothetical protein FOCG_09497 [Fusarium oxysporum f. sp. radicis-lycopersici 26381]|nr:hypothetical protein FOWG_08526 [Fusarium oxysporum f. sp. lycopersici MN25]EXL48902.1 hypothetical protein FOCG_09497 [Fusarium oxysporum f. sp. radicis-lycopersici 26381]KAJ4158745.1 hypothetical protein NW765_012387 [Fusarium oxysporum]KAJ4278787.1 hypothetical protein NW764_007578 [Fusarium oxysporum]